MIRAVICDDEKASLAIIRSLIESEGLPIEIVGTASNGQSGLELIQKEEPDLAFLEDVYKRQGIGIGLIQQLSIYSQCDRRPAV